MSTNEIRYYHEKTNDVLRNGNITITTIKQAAVAAKQ
jgi:hypothetical protein